MIRRIFKSSKWMHKYFGLFLILFTIWMSISGILLNHPDLIAGFSVPGWLVPDQYTPQNWNRSALISMVYSERDSNVAYAGGKQGIWRTVDGGRTFEPFMDGFPDTPYYNKTKHLFLNEGNDNFLLAATDGGLYVCDPEAGKWRPVRLSDEREAVRKILQAGDEIFVFSESNVYAGKYRDGEFDLKKIDWQRQEKEVRVTLVDLFFHLHDGRVWGLPGKLLFDFTGLVIIFLSFTAFYIWYFPKKMRHRLKKKKTKNAREKAKNYRLFFKYHLKLGIWLALIMLILGSTGFFMRPPLLVLIANGSIPARLYPGILPANPWHDKVHNALYDPIENDFIVNTKDGNWRGPADFSKPFTPYALKAPVFVMGPTAFDAYGSGGYLVGSFSGIFHQERASGKVIDMLSGKIAPEISNVRPADFMVTGYFKTPQGQEFITTHEQGLHALEGAIPEGQLRMPARLISDFRMPLWNYMFEIHNGRFFKEWLGGLYILIAPLGSLLFVIITLSGIYDWLYLRKIKKKS